MFAGKMSPKNGKKNSLAGGSKVREENNRTWQVTGGGKTPMANSRKVQLCILLGTVIAFLALGTIRSVYLCVSYPQTDVSLQELVGEDQENLGALSAEMTTGKDGTEGVHLTATANTTQILYTLPSAIPVKMVEYDVSQLSRENCWSYIDRIGTTKADREAVTQASADSTLTGAGTSDDSTITAVVPHNLGEGSVIMALGRNYITFDNATPDEQITSLDMLPVTLRAVNFTYTRFLLNPHGRFVFITFRAALFFLTAAVLLELVIFSLIRSYQQNAKKKSSLPVAVILGSIQAVHAVYFCYQFMIAGWEAYTMTYFLLIYVCTSLFLLVVCQPDLHLVTLDNKGNEIRAPRPGKQTKTGRNTGKTASVRRSSTKGNPGKRSRSKANDSQPASTTVVFRRELPVLRILLLTVLDFATTEALYSDRFKLDKPVAIVGNLLIYALLYEIMYCITPGRHARALVYIIPQAVWLSVAGINHYYFQYRSQCFEYSDMTMVGTFKNVASEYPLTLSPELFLVYLSSAAVIIALSFENRKVYQRKTWKAILPGVAVAAFTLLWLPANIPYVSLWNTNTATRHNGYAFSYLSYAQKSLEKPTPEGYNAKETQEMLEQYVVTGEGTNKSGSGTDGSEENGGAGGQDGNDGTDSSVRTAQAESSSTNSQVSTMQTAGNDGGADHDVLTVQAAGLGTAGKTSTGLILNGNAAEKTASTSTDTSAAVNIIVIMDEALSDLPQTYGFDVDQDNLPYIHSLSGSNVKKGKMLVSVFGGTTADTEYEFLTGNSISFLNGEAVPYTQYINSEQQSLARLLKNRGYSATAFHPYYADGYKRYKVYPLLGFDQFLASDNTELPYTARLRSYISDDSDVRDVIDMYENREKYGITSQKGEPFFLFNVTMQNHGGYNSQVSAVDVTVKPTDPDLANLSELQEYLSLTRATDAAFEKLTSYFSQVEEKTIILMFGDHQPSMGEYVYKAMYPQMYTDSATIEDKDKKYTVPYVMWANYDLPEGELPVTSPNFLRSFLLENAGLTPSAYDNFVSTVRSEYPAMNRLGCLDAAGNYNDVSIIDDTTTLMNYKKAAYYNLFDHRHVEESLFE